MSKVRRSFEIFRCEYVAQNLDPVAAPLAREREAIALLKPVQLPRLEGVEALTLRERVPDDARGLGTGLPVGAKSSTPI